MPLAPTDTETFTVDRDGLHRHVTPRRGKPYTHTCPQDSFEVLCHRLDEADPTDRHRIEDVVGRDPESGVRILSTQAAVSLAFLRERGILGQQRRLNVVEPGYRGSVHNHGMIEYYALEHAGAER